MKDTQDLIKLVDNAITETKDLDVVFNLSLIKDGLVALDEKLDKVNEEVQALHTVMNINTYK